MRRQEEGACLRSHDGALITGGSLLHRLRRQELVDCAAAADVDADLAVRIRSLPGTGLAGEAGARARIAEGAHDGRRNPPTVVLVRIVTMALLTVTVQISKSPQLRWKKPGVCFYTKRFNSTVIWSGKSQRHVGRVCFRVCSSWRE